MIIFANNFREVIFLNLDFLMVTKTLTGLFVLIAFGYGAVKFGMINASATVHFSALLMKVTLPCTIFISLVQKEYDPAFIYDALIMIASGLVLYSCMLYFSKFAAKIFGVKKNSIGIWAFSTTYSNAGFVAFPIALALLGREGLALAVMLNMTFNITAYTLGSIEIAKDSASTSGELDMKSVIFSTINFAIVLSLIFYFGRIELPELAATSINYVSNITTPLSMLLIGMSLAKSHTQDILKNMDAWTCAAMRLIIYPLILCGLFRIFVPWSNPMITAVIILVMAMPVASTAVILAENYNSNADLAAEALFISNIACIITIPLMCTLIPV